MARLTPILLVGLCAVSALTSVVEKDDSGSKADDVFSDYVEENGQKIEVADPLGDPSESDSVFQDSTADWQTEMVMGLLKQRKAEKDFITRLEVGGTTLNEMVVNITNAFNKLEKARQVKGAQLIKQHFQTELALLRASQTKSLASLSDLLASDASDSAAVASLKTKVSSVIKANFKLEIDDQKASFEQQLKQLKQEHTKQMEHVKQVYALIYKWKNTFHSRLVKSQKDLQNIMEKWDWL